VVGTGIYADAGLAALGSLARDAADLAEGRRFPGAGRAVAGQDQSPDPPGRGSVPWQRPPPRLYPPILGVH
jgi:hypothetical protein